MEREAGLSWKQLESRLCGRKCNWRPQTHTLVSAQRQKSRKEASYGLSPGTLGCLSLGGYEVPYNLAPIYLLELISFSFSLHTVISTKLNIRPLQAPRMPVLLLEGHPFTRTRSN
jgi:hypothetical protein